MRRWLSCAVCLLAAWTSGPARAANPGEDFDRRINTELRERDAAAADLFAEANAKRKTEDHAAAAALYARVFELAPWFVHARRRQGFEELELGHRDVALRIAREVVKVSQAPENLSFLAVVLSAAGPKMSEAERKEALALAQRVTREARRDEALQLTAGDVAVRLGDAAVLGSAVSNLKVISPHGPGTHTLDAILLVFHGSFRAAHAALREARAAGMPEAQYQSLSRAIDRSRPWWLLSAEWGAVAVAIWLGVFAALFLAGTVLSRATLRTASGASEAGVAATSRHRVLRRTYAAVLGASSLFYYVSLPLLVFVVAAVGGGVILAFFMWGHVPVKLVAIIGVLTLVSIAAIVRSLFVRGSREDPGTKLGLAGQPRLRAALDEVAGRVGTRPVDNVYLTPGTDFAVTERGGFLRQMRGTSERCLILGVGVLPEFKLPAFKAVLAHEYGHFSNRDTAGGGFALTVRRSILKMGAHLAEGGAANWWNPAWLFVNGFHRVFLRISQGASRLQEMLADRWAALAYGSAAFEDGLRHVVAQAVRFDAHVQTTLDEVVERKRALANLYTYVTEKDASPAEIEEKIREALERPASPYDSHPRPVDRFAWVRRLAAADAASASTQDAWSLFEDRESVERSMTEHVKQVLARQGMEFPEVAAAS